MVVRRVLITQNSNIANFAELLRHPNVKKCWQLPRGYVLFEFYHRVFERIYDNDLSVRHAARVEEDVRTQIAAAMAEERRILEPLFKGRLKDFQGVQLGIPGQTALTLFLGRDTIQWTEIKLYAGWETAKESVFAMRLVIITDDTVRELRKVIQQWAESGIAQGEIEAVGPVTFNDRDAQVRCRFVGPTCTDAIMALYMLLTDTRALTSVESLVRVVTKTSPAES